MAISSSIRSRRARRSTKRRTLLVSVAVVLATLATSAHSAAAQTDPYLTNSTELAWAPGNSTHTLLVGDSLISAANFNLGVGAQTMANKLRDQNGRGTYVSAAVGASWTNYGVPGQEPAGTSLVWSLADGLDARMTIIALGTNDAGLIAKGKISGQTQFDRMLYATTATRNHSTCVLVVNVPRRNASGVTIAAANTVNNNMNLLAASRTGVYVADWATYANGHEDWFNNTNDVHMNSTGKGVYRDFINYIALVRMGSGC